MTKKRRAPSRQEPDAVDRDLDLGELELLSPHSRSARRKVGKRKAPRRILKPKAAPKFERFADACIGRAPRFHPLPEPHEPPVAAACSARNRTARSGGRTARGRPTTRRTTPRSAHRRCTHPAHCRESSPDAPGSRTARRAPETARKSTGTARIRTREIARGEECSGARPADGVGGAGVAVAAHARARAAARVEIAGREWRSDERALAFLTDRDVVRGTREPRLHALGTTARWAAIAPDEVHGEQRECGQARARSGGDGEHGFILLVVPNVVGALAGLGHVPEDTRSGAFPSRRSRRAPSRRLACRSGGSRPGAFVRGHREAVGGRQAHVGVAASIGSGRQDPKSRCSWRVPSRPLIHTATSRADAAGTGREPNRPRTYACCREGPSRRASHYRLLKPMPNERRAPSA